MKKEKNSQKEQSVLYLAELNRNLLVLFVNVILIALPTVVLFNAKTWFRGDWTIITYFSVIILFSVLKIVKQIILTFNLRKTSLKISEDRMDTYIYLNWVKNSQRANLTLFTLLFFSVIASSISLIYNSAVYRMDMTSLYSLFAFLSAMALYLLGGIENKNRMNRYLTKYSKFLRMDTLKDEIETIRLIENKFNKDGYKVILLTTSIIGIPFINRVLNRK